MIWEKLCENPHSQNAFPTIYYDKDDLFFRNFEKNVIQHYSTEKSVNILL